MRLRRYWLTFDLSIDDPHPIGVLPGCGVTAYDRDEALRLVRQHVFARHPFPQLKSLVEDVDVSSLDPGHVRSNMENPVERGIWFPRGYRGLG